MMAWSSTVYVRAGHLASILPSSPLSNFEFRQRRRLVDSSVVKCSQEARQTRRFVSLSFVFFHCFSLSTNALGSNILDKYVKKKKLDPLETYIPAVLLTGLQIKELEHSLEVDQPKYGDCRNLLRSGPASSFRINIRAVAQYASDAGNGKPAFQDVDQCLRALEELDSLLLQASRNQSEASVDLMKSKVVTVLDALDSLLKFVPSEVLDRGKAMADAYFIPDEILMPENLDPQLKKLESIL